MKKNLSAIIISIIVIVLLIFISIKNPNDKKIETNNDVAINKEVPTPIPAEKIEVVHFHGTQQCISCITVGEYALKTIKERFPDEYESGVIVFKEINGELPENRDIVMKYKATGSSLFINAITGEDERIKENINVWYLVSNENNFKNYFENELKTILGKN